MTVGTMTPVRKTKIWNIENSKCSQGYRTTRTFIHCWLEYKMYEHFRKLMVSYEAKHIPTIWSSDNTPWYLPKGAENTFTQNPTHMLMVALLIIAKTWKWPRCPAGGG